MDFRMGWGKCKAKTSEHFKNSEMFAYAVSRLFKLHTTAPKMTKH